MFSSPRKGAQPWNERQTWSHGLLKKITSCFMHQHPAHIPQGHVTFIYTSHVTHASIMCIYCWIKLVALVSLDTLEAACVRRDLHGLRGSPRSGKVTLQDCPPQRGSYKVEALVAAGQVGSRQQSQHNSCEDLSTRNWSVTVESTFQRASCSPDNPEVLRGAWT